MPRPRPLPDDLGDCFAVADALDAGVSRRRLRALDLDPSFHGARRALPEKEYAAKRKSPGRADPAGLQSDTANRAQSDSAPLALDRQRQSATLQRARTYATIMRPGAFFSGNTAACLFGAPVAPDALLDVSVPAPRRAPRASGIRGRKVAPHLVSIQDLDGLPVSTPATTWAMLGRDLSERELVVVGDFFVHIPRDRTGRQQPQLALATIEDLRIAAGAGARPPSTALLRTALERIRVGSASPLETDFRLDAETAGLPLPDLDVEIRDDRGRLLGISEFVYPQFRTVVEIEGDHHRTSREQWNRDIEKYRRYADAGWQVVRLTSKHVRTSRHGVSDVATALSRRGWGGFQR